MRQHRLRHAPVVGDQIALREAGLRKQDLVPVGDLQPPPVDQHREGPVWEPLHLLEQRIRGFARDLSRGLVLAQALERWSAHHAVDGPFGELDLGDEARLHEHRLARQLRRICKWVCVAHQWTQPLRQRAKRRFGEAGTDAPRIPEFSVLIEAHQQRPDPLGAAPFAGNPAADHQLLAGGVLELDPRPGAPAGLIARIDPLGDDPFKPLRTRGLEQSFAFARMGGRHPPGRASKAQRLQSRASLVVGQLHQRVPVQVQQVEDRIDDRRAGSQPAHRRGRGHMHPLLQAPEVRPGRVGRIIEGDVTD